METDCNGEEHAARRVPFVLKEQIVLMLSSMTEAKIDDDPIVDVELTTRENLGGSQQGGAKLWF